MDDIEQVNISDSTEDNDAEDESNFSAEKVSYQLFGIFI